jgi:hypothetical protein
VTLGIGEGQEFLQFPVGLEGVGGEVIERRLWILRPKFPLMSP